MITLKANIPPVAGPETLAENEVHVWQISLRPSQDIIRDCCTILSPGEHDRASRFHFERDAERFIAARCAMRRILSLYTLVAPKELAFCYGEKGKPYLSPLDRFDIQFNLAHSGEIGLLAVVQSGCVGVDIEMIDGAVDGDGIAERFFSRKEVKALRALSSEERTLAFFRCWTCKEAYIKALGEGLSLPLDCFDVELNPRIAPALLEVRGHVEEPSRWKIYDIPVPTGYQAALVVEGFLHHLRLHSWEWEL